MIGADMAVLPAAYREIGQDLSISPAGLGAISLAVGITSNVASLLPALFAGRVSRPALVSFGCLMWAAGLLTQGAPAGGPTGPRGNSLTPLELSQDRKYTANNAPSRMARLPAWSVCPPS